MEKKSGNAGRAGELQERFRQWVQGGTWKRWLKRDNLVILVLTGVLLFIIALPGERKDDAGGDRNEAVGQETPEPWGGTAGGGEDLSGEEAEERYLEEHEKRLTEALSQVDGVGRVRVMITLKSSRELVVERERAIDRSSVSEEDSKGGSRVTSQAQIGDSVVYRGGGTDSEPYVIKTLPPGIEGVLVVAEGAGSGEVDRTITAIVKALFGVEAHKVTVVKMSG